MGNVGPTPGVPPDASWQPADSEIAPGHSLAVATAANEATNTSEASAAPTQSSIAVDDGLQALSSGHGNCEDECNKKECTGGRGRDARQGSLAFVLKNQNAEPTVHSRLSYWYRDFTGRPVKTR